MLQIKNYVKVSSIEEAYELNQKKNNVVIGGMHWLKMSHKNVDTAIDLSGLGLDQIVEDEDAFEIGCMVSLRDLELHESLNNYCQGAVRDALKDIVGVQFRNTATIGGSIYGRFGFSDILTVFMAMDTKVSCYKAGEISIIEFSQMGYDRDIIEKIIVKKTPIKISYQAIRRIRTDFPALACAVSYYDGRWRAVIGAKPKKAQMVLDDEGILNDGISENSAISFGEYATGRLIFGTNMRGSAEYRQMTAPVLVKRALMDISEMSAEV